MSDLLRAVARRLNYANVVATLALFVALGGVSYAAVAIPRESVGTAELRRDAVTSDKVRDGTLAARDFRASERGRLRGARGPAGAQGPTGARGARGARGATGAAGPTGASGADGAPGRTGETGPQGPAGPRGATGPRGLRGERGATGERGERGETGATGERGERGERGETGATGERGERGERGDTGPQGPPGSADAWARAGNAGTTAEEFLGTTDDRPLELRVGGERALRLTPNADAPPTLVGGAAANSADAEAVGATVGGGGSADAPQRAGAPYATVAGGRGNSVLGVFGAVGGGTANSAAGVTATVGGGEENVAGNDATTVSGGVGNTASGPYATVAGGRQNTASGDYATVLGGRQNEASGHFATAFGSTSVASGGQSLAAGTAVTASHRGAFVLGDSNETPFESGADDELAMRFAGGFRWRTTADGATGCQLEAGSASITCTSDRQLKRAFRPLDRERLLTRLLGMPIRTWEYRAERGGVRHLGPTAQAFKAAFGLGRGNTTIGQLDEAGVALAVGQALAEKADASERRVARLERRLQALERAVRARR